MCEAADGLLGEYLGDDAARDVLRYLLDGASKPYHSMLRGWLESGTLRDPHGEFMVEAPHRRDRGSGSGRGEAAADGSAPVGDGGDGDDWDTWFAVREEHVPRDLRGPDSCR